MITNNIITYYHKVFNKTTKLDEWQRIIFNNVWVFINKGSNINKGYENSNNIDVRIPMEEIKDSSIFNIFSIGDIIAIGIQPSINEQNDLQGKDFYNITNINTNSFGNNPHIHLGGK